MNEDSSVLFTASYDKTVSAWDLRSNSREPIQIMKDFTDSVTSVILSQSSVIASSVDGCLRTYDIRSNMLNCDDIKDPITCVRLTNDNKCALCTCLGGILKLVNLSTGQVLQEYSGGHTHESFKLESLVANDDCHVISCSEDGYFVHYNLVSGKLVRKTLTSTTSSSFSSTNNYNNSDSENNNDNNNNKSNNNSNTTINNIPTSTASAHLSPALSSLCYHPTKPLLLTASYNGAVKIWDCSRKG